jgi:hypothetical protein
VINARRPKIRVRVTPSAVMLINQRRLMSDRLWDRFVGTQFPHPGQRMTSAQAERPRQHA